MIKFKNRKFAALLAVTPILLVLQLIVCIGIFAYIKAINKVEDESLMMDNYMRLNIRYITVAESAQRGYFLTNDSSYLQPYFMAIQELINNEDSFDSLFAGMDTRHLTEVRRLSKHKLNELDATIDLYNANKKDSALIIVKTGYGAAVMDSLRNETREIRTDINGRIMKMQSREFLLIYTLLGLIIVLIVFNIFVAAYNYKWVVNNTAKLEESVDSLEKSNEMLRNYTNMSYHELKTPLRSITGFLQLLRKKYGNQLDGEATEFVQFITEGVVQMNNTINNLRKNHLEKQE